VIISSLLKSFLGFDKLNFPPGDYKAPYVADVTRGVNSLYVYCPLVESRMVGDAQVPLLRIVPVAGRDGEMMTCADIVSLPVLSPRIHPNLTSPVIV
jgi:hypothetical protein